MGAFNNSSAAIIFHSLKENIGVEKLTLDNCVLHNEGFEKLASLLQRTKTIRELNINNCKYLGASTEDARGQVSNMIHILKAMQTNTSLTTLNIGVFRMHFIRG